MSNIRAIRHVDRIININQGGGSKKQGIPSSTNLITTAHVAFRNRNVVCACNRDVIFCMNQLGGIGAGGIPGRSYMFASTADGVSKNKILCGINHKNIKHPSQFELIYSEPVGGTNNPLQISFDSNLTINYWQFSNHKGAADYPFITNCFNSGSGNGSDVSCYNREVVGYTYAIIFTYNGKIYNVTFLITGYIDSPGGYLTVKFLSNPSSELLQFLRKGTNINIIKAYKSTYKVNV